jgi:hypothetical protein
MASYNSITKFKDGFKGGSRPNRFEVVPTWPSGVSVPTEDGRFKIISASLPQAKINTIGVPYRGRTITFAGDRSYAPWLVGVYDDNNSQSLWRAFHQWKEDLDGHYNHTVKNNNYGYENLQTTWTVHQYDTNGSTIARTIRLYKCWPSVIGEINLNMGENNFVAFNVSLTFDYFEIVKGIRTSPGGI